MLPKRDELVLVTHRNGNSVEVCEECRDDALDSDPLFWRSGDGVPTPSGSPTASPTTLGSTSTTPVSSTAVEADA